MRYQKDISGTKFYGLTANKPVGYTKERTVIWECTCICGKIKNVSRNSLVTGNTRSCGCTRKGCPVKDITGLKTEKLTVLRFHSMDKWGGSLWVCKCECGKEKIIRSSSLTSSKQKSCGCILAKAGERRRTHGLTKDPSFVMWTSARKRSEKADIPFTIQWTDIVIPEICPVFGLKLKKNEGIHRDDSPSLDKKIPELGYIPGNIAVISWRANRLKSTMTVEEVKQLYDYMGDDNVSNPAH